MTSTVGLDIVSHDLSGGTTQDQISAWFRSRPKWPAAGLVYVGGVQPSRADALAWLDHTPNCQQWDAIFVLRYRDGEKEHWLLVRTRRREGVAL